MKRFCVVKASQVAFVAAAVLLAAVLIALTLRYVSAQDSLPAGMFQVGGEYASEAAQAAFAVSGLEIEVARETEISPTDAPEMRSVFIAEDEHTDAVAAAPEPKWQPSVLIYHTHTHEAYQPTADSGYEPSGERWRTTDTSCNVVRVGEALRNELEARGIRAVHDTTDHEQDDFQTAYERSLQTLQRHSGEGYDLYIDLHRDAYGTDPEDAVTVSVGQKTMAKLMLLVGTGEGFSVPPDSAANYAFALQLTDRVNEVAPGLCRDVLVKSKRYNQHVGRCILLEVGHNLNTLDQALATMPYFAEALADVLTEDSDRVITLQGK